MTWTGKYKLGVIAGTRVNKYNLGTKTGAYKVSVRVGKHRLGTRAAKYKFRPGPVNTNWGL